MSRQCFVLTAILLQSSLNLFSADPVNTLSDDEKNADFVLMFNGKDFEGWQQSGNWVIEEDGSIFRKNNGGPLKYFAHQMPQDFELRFEWKVARGSNSGVYYRPGQYEYQILDNTTHSDGKNPRTSAASLYFCMAPSKDNTQPVGEWNQGEILCKGSVIKHILNGEAVVDFDYNDPKWTYNKNLIMLRGGNLDQRGGHVSLQDHNDLVWYRNLRFRAISADETINPSLSFKPTAIPDSGYAYEQKWLERQLSQAAEKNKK